jgi:hypothetical protein
MKKEQKHHDRIVAWSAIGFLVTLVIGLSLNLSADPVGDCTAGTQIL